MTVYPCNGCEERHAECHAECEKYKEWQSIHEAEKNERYQRERPAIMTTTYKVDTALKNKKRRRKGH